MKKNDCGECILKEKCVYSYVFETPPPSDTKIMRKYKSAPHPLIIEPPPERRRAYTPKDEITFGLTLLGRAVDYLPYFIYTFDELGKMGIGKGRGKYELKRVMSYESGVKSKEKEYAGVIPAEAEIQGNLIEIYSSDTITLKTFKPSSLSLSFDFNLKTHNSSLLTLLFTSNHSVTGNTVKTLFPHVVSGNPKSF